MALVGVFLIMAVRSAEVRPFALAIAPMLAYFYLTVALVGADAYFRSRAPHVPFLIALAGVAAARLIDRSASWRSAHGLVPTSR